MGFLDQVPLTTLLQSGSGKQILWPFLSPAPTADIFLFLPAGTDSLREHMGALCLCTSLCSEGEHGHRNWRKVQAKRSFSTALLLYSSFYAHAGQAIKPMGGCIPCRTGCFSTEASSSEAHERGVGTPTAPCPWPGSAG